MNVMVVVVVSVHSVVIKISGDRQVRLVAMPQVVIIAEEVHEVEDVQGDHDKVIPVTDSPVKHALMAHAVLMEITNQESVIILKQGHVEVRLDTESKVDMVDVVRVDLLHEQDDHHAVVVRVKLEDVGRIRKTIATIEKHPLRVLFLIKTTVRPELLLKLELQNLFLLLM